MASQLVVALLALASLGAASELDCKDLVKPLVLDSHSPVSISDHLVGAGHMRGGSVAQRCVLGKLQELKLYRLLQQILHSCPTETMMAKQRNDISIYGKWVLHVGAWDQPGLKNDLATVNSSWVDLSPSSDNGVMTIYWSDRLGEDRCLQGIANATISGMTSHTTFIINGHTSYHDGKYYETCADCLLSEDTTLLPDGKSKGRYLFLFTRTGTLESSELETFKKQAECLKFYPEYHFGGTELCPDEREPATPAAETTENTENMENNQTDVEPTAAK